MIATGTPSPTFSLSGSVPTWLSTDPTTGMLSGTPPAGSGGTYSFTVTAANGVTPDATQAFTLTVLRAVHPVPVTPTSPTTSTTPPPAPAPAAPAHTTAAAGSLAVTGIDLAGLLGTTVLLLGTGAVLWMVSADRRRLHLLHIRRRPQSSG